MAKTSPRKDRKAKTARAAKGGRRLRTSRHLSFFRKKDELFAYHDLWGYVLGMDRNVHDFVVAFGEGRTPGAVIEAFADRFRPEEAEGFLAGFEQHRCLVSPRADEEGLAFEKGYPVKASWVVAYAPSPDEAVLAYKDRGLGRIVLERLDRLGARLFHAATGEKTAAEIAALLAPDFPSLDVPAELRRVLFRLTHSDRQILKLTDRPLFEYLAFPPPYLRSTMPFPRLEEADAAQAGEEEAPPVVDLAAFHRKGIEDAASQFDVEETTLSHMFREPHEALGGRSYGEAFLDALLEKGLFPSGDGRRPLALVEVGGGVGFFALRLLRALATKDRSLYDRTQYAILDLSQVLQDSQRLLTFDLEGKVRHVLANASRGLPFRERSVDLLISNEVIADLETVRLEKARLPELQRRARALACGPAGAPRDPLVEAASLIARTGLDVSDAPEVFWLNLGALRLVEELARVLRPGGAALLIEFGGESRYPVESTHLGHSEFSIHYGHVRDVARAAGLECELTDIMSLLAMRGDVRVLSTTRTYFEALRALLERRGISLQKLAYTEADFERLLGGRIDREALHGVTFRPTRDRALGLHPPEFLVAIIRKPLADRE